MQVVSKVMWFGMAVSDMPKAKAFYVDKLGLKVASDYRRDDNNWWVSVSLPEGGASITLTTAHEHEARHDEGVLCGFRYCRGPQGAPRKGR